MILAVVCILVPSISISAQVPGVTQISQDGFGDASNSYSWSAAWFDGKLYVGTARNIFCVEAATLDFFQPEENHYPPNNPTIPCPEDKYDLDLRAEIWSYTPETDTWDMVYQSPTVQNPRALRENRDRDKEIALDIGYRGMVVYNGALYVGGVTANQYIPELAEDHPPRLLRTTDGQNFEEVPVDIPFLETIEGQQRPIGFRSMEVMDDRLFVTMSRGLVGDGAIVEIREPESDSPVFDQISPADLQIFELEVYRDTLYAGAGNLIDGYSVWKVQIPPGRHTRIKFDPIVTNGAGRGTDVNSVVSMHVFEDRLYVGANGWYQTLFPGSELIRINPNDSWDLIVGNARFTEGEFKFPISGFRDGFDNIFNAHFWRMMEHQDTLELGTNDWSHQLAGVPVLGPLLSPGFGFDVWGSCNGQFWWSMTENAFGDGEHNFGARIMQSSEDDGYIGSANHVEGTAVWRQPNPTLCALLPGTEMQQSAGLESIEPNNRGGASTSDSGSELPPPDKVLAEIETCGAVVSWESSGEADSFRILRATSEVVEDVPIPEPVTFPGGGVPEIPSMSGDTRLADVEVMGAFESIASTNQNFFVDSSVDPAGEYLYQVIAESQGRASQVSTASNVAPAPAERPDNSFDDLRTTGEEMVDRGSLPAGKERRVRHLVDDAESSFDRGNTDGSQETLAELESIVAEELSQGIAIYDQHVRSDLQNFVSLIDRVSEVYLEACADSSGRR